MAIGVQSVWGSGCKPGTQCFGVLVSGNQVVEFVEGPERVKEVRFAGQEALPLLHLT